MDEERLFLCEICGKLLKTNRILKTHKQKVHSDERPFSCKWCDKSFKRKGGLKTHMRIHTGEKPYSCSICSKRFVQLCHLQKHQKRCHGISKGRGKSTSNSCEICEIIKNTKKETEWVCIQCSSNNSNENKICQICKMERSDEIKKDNNNNNNNKILVDELEIDLHEDENEDEDFKLVEKNHNNEQPNELIKDSTNDDDDDSDIEILDKAKKKNHIIIDINDYGGNEKTRLPHCLCSEALTGISFKKGDKIIYSTQCKHAFKVSTKNAIHESVIEKRKYIDQHGFEYDYDDADYGICSIKFAGRDLRDACPACCAGKDQYETNEDNKKALYYTGQEIWDALKYTKDWWILTHVKHWSVQSEIDQMDKSQFIKWYYNILKSQVTHSKYYFVNWILKPVKQEKITRQWQTIIFDKCTHK